MCGMYERVLQFYDAMGMDRPDAPAGMGANRRNQRMTYLLSEIVEFGEANRLHTQVAELTDLLYFVLGTFAELGVDPEMPFTIVHQANMAKLWSDGLAHWDVSVVPPRLLRPPTWKSPSADIECYVMRIVNETR